MDDYPGDGSEMTGPGIGNEKRGMARTFPRFSLPGAHRLAAKYEFLILEVEAAELNLESTDALPLVASGRAGNDERCRNFSIVCDCLTRVFEGLGRNRVVGTGRDRSEKIVVETAEETQSAQDIRFGNQQQDRVAVEEGSAFQFVDEIAPSRRFIVVVTYSCRNVSVFGSFSSVRMTALQLSQASSGPQGSFSHSYFSQMGSKVREL